MTFDFWILNFLYHLSDYNKKFASDLAMKCSNDLDGADLILLYVSFTITIFGFIYSISVWFDQRGILYFV